MIVLWILLALLALLAALLFVNVHLIFRYEENATVTLRVLFFRFDAMKLISRFTQDRKKAKAEKAVSVTETALEPKKKRKFDPVGFAEFLLHITEVVGKAIREHFSHMTVNLKKLCVRIGTEDAATTALLCGGAIQAANGLCALLQRFSRFRCDSRNLSISPDFTSETSSFSLHLDLASKPVFLIAVLIRAYFRFFEGKENKNVRNSAETSH